jgi:2-dehydropantoate 2-reductase
MAMSKEPHNPTLDLMGAGMKPLRINEATLAHLPPEFHVEDINRLMPSMRGKGVKVAGLLELATFPSNADHVTFFSHDGQYSASLTLDQAKNYGIVVYQVDGEPLPSDKGGPFRLVTPGLGDLCANVKNISVIEVTVGSGKDTRPEERSC